MAAPEEDEDKKPEETMRAVVAGRSDLGFCDNTISTYKYTVISFLPIAIREQFRRIANVFFLVVGCIMAIGYYTDLYESAIDPWTTLGPLAVVISVSLIQEGAADYGRHKSDENMNNHPCVVLRRADELDQSEEPRTRDETVGTDVAVDLRKAYFVRQQNTETPVASVVSETPFASVVSESIKVAFEKVPRKNIRVGDLVLVRNRDMIPADIILLASSSEGGSAYIETSSIDGETNLKLRTSPHLPKDVLQIIRNERSTQQLTSEEGPIKVETLEQATKRITRLSALGYPDGKSVLDNPANPTSLDDQVMEKPKQQSLLRRMSVGDMVKAVRQNVSDVFKDINDDDEDTDSIIKRQEKYLATLKSESPNPSVNTYSGVLVFPPVELGGPGVELPLNADSMLLRGAVLRNTEWAIGLVCFTGSDTKLDQNSVDTPSKFSQLDKLMNFAVICIICLMVIIIAILSTLNNVTVSRQFDELWYIGFNTDAAQKWPYLPDLESPSWRPANDNWIQTFLLFITLLTNFVPLSLYITIEFVTLMIRFLINHDIDMYHDGTDTRALARSTNVTDLGQVQYVFSDKTGTLTQNVMGFKRCSVDGMIFGAPIEKARVGDHGDEKDNEGPTSSFHPLRQLLVGKTKLKASSSRAGLERLGGTTDTLALDDKPTSNAKMPRGMSAGLEPMGEEGTTDTLVLDDKLTFNAEMFLRVMSLCHTVVVEKDLDAADTLNRPEGKVASSEKSSLSSSLHRAARKIFGTKKSTSTDDSSAPASSDNEFTSKEKTETKTSSTIPTGTSKDGAPIGYAYQAESPDEGALVQAASCSFGFQVIGRDSSGIKLACSSPSLLEDEQIVKGLKKGTLTPKVLAAETAIDLPTPGSSGADVTDGNVAHSNGIRRVETWAILAVNKFDSDRKRMSVLVRTPPEFGSIPILFCKGADSSMLDANICEDSDNILSGSERQEDMEVLLIPKPTTVNRNSSVDNYMSPVLEDDSEDDEDGMKREEEVENWESAAMLGIQAHLGTFAKEGLRTLVLGMRVLSDRQCEDWLSRYSAASTSLKNREAKLTEVAKEIERHLHIVGATAIEDKLQRGVPETIKKLEKAGIKLWVLTGDKRETAIEIGYSTHVLTPKMHLTEVADGPADDVRTLMAMEFIRLVKMGRLTEYQRSVLSRDQDGSSLLDFKFRMGKIWRTFSRALRRFFWTYICCRYRKAKGALSAIEHEESLEDEIMQAKVRRRNVRDRAEKIIQAYLQSPQGKEQSERRKARGVHHGDDASESLSLASDELPTVFNRAESARMILEQRRSQGKLTKNELRTLSLAQLTAQQAADHSTLVDEDTLSLRSFMPDDKNATDFDRKKRTLLERVFAVDKDVRHGRLRKHARPEALQSIEEEGAGRGESTRAHDICRPRALVIEGAALAHLLGDMELEELLFAVASCSDSVIACRVSPKQKALLVGLVRAYVSPEPLTLAIGDGANDVGMIQEAHVGVGISGKEGQQAVNASDFAIAQFRFLEELLLIHGRWSFFRESAVVLFSFYKNAVLAGCLIVFQSRVVYSGTPLFDDWLIAMLNFISGIPIMFTGFFDRCLSKEYVRNHPEVYGAGRRNELITGRTLFRWIILVFVHVFCIFYLTVPTQTSGGGITSAFSGLMSNDDLDVPGNGEGGDLTSVGTVSYSCMIILFAYKVLFESRSLIYGWWPAITCCRKNVVHPGFFNRLAYTWIGIVLFSIGFYIWAIYVLMLLGRDGAGPFSRFADVPIHVFHMRSISWFLLILVPFAGTVLDVTGKVYSNLFYPTQTQIHVERFCKGLDSDTSNSDEAPQPGSESNV